MEIWDEDVGIDDFMGQARFDHLYPPPPPATPPPAAVSIPAIPTTHLPIPPAADDRWCRRISWPITPQSEVIRAIMLDDGPCCVDTNIPIPAREPRALRRRS